MIGIVFALTVQAASVPAQAAPVSGSGDPVIVVTARRLDDARTELAACIARTCSPDEEMRGWLKQVDAQFLAGDYVGARLALAKARGRNTRYAKQHPVLVSEIWRADSRIASVLGLRAESQVSARGASDALRAGLPANDPRILLQRLEVADAYAMESNTERADKIYREVERAARDIGARQVEGRAMLRIAILYAALARRQPAYKEVAFTSIDAIMHTTDAAMAPIRDAAGLVRLKLDLALDPDKPIDAAQRALSGTVTVPVVIRSPEVVLGLPGVLGATSAREFNDAATSGGSGAVAKVFPVNYNLERQWVDIGFRIAPDGSVGDIDMIRQGDKSVDLWTPNVREALAGRRYAPLGGEAAKTGMYRIERYSLVADLGVSTGSRIPAQSGIPHVEVTDITNARKVM